MKYKLYTLDNKFVGDNETYPKHFTGSIIDENGNKIYFLNGIQHRSDGPAVEYYDGRKYWYTNGSLHRIGGPACEYPDGTKYWYVDGKRHREDGPAIEYYDGRKKWFINNKEIVEEEHDLLYSIMKLKGLL